MRYQMRLVGRWDMPMNKVTRASTVAAVLLAAMIAMTGGAAIAADPITKDQAVAMVKKAVAYIKEQGPDKAYAEIDNKTGQFVDGDLYIAVVGLDGTLLAYGSDAHRVGDNVIDLKDVDGQEVIKERVALAKSQPSFWQSYKFMNPVSKKIEPKEMYCETLEQTVVCGGVYVD
jgi:cytochrome c